MAVVGRVKLAYDLVVRIEKGRRSQGDVGPVFGMIRSPRGGGDLDPGEPDAAYLNEKALPDIRWNLALPQGGSHEKQ